MKRIIVTALAVATLAFPAVAPAEELPDGPEIEVVAQPATLAEYEAVLAEEPEVVEEEEQEPTASVASVHHQHRHHRHHRRKRR